ncbi:MAG: 2-amino-4-hydroxy-6-hydroxymethyldihydropteridine diphosphokinase [Magnetococcus sp. DMHC-6]
MSVPILITFGSNVDPLAHLWKGLTLLHQKLPIEAISTVYRTPALGHDHQPMLGPNRPPDYLNGALLTLSTIEPFTLRHLLRHIEDQLQRVRHKDRYAPRTLDLDIALMGNLILQKRSLSIPDPDIPKRNFLSVPLAQLAPDLIHPLYGLTLANMARGLEVGMSVDLEATASLQTIKKKGGGLEVHPPSF